MERKATAVWKGTLQEGQGVLTTESRALTETPYSFRSRFGVGDGPDVARATNPEELIASAHAGCFAMAFSNEVTKAQLLAELVEVTASVHLEKIKEQWGIPRIHLEVRARIPNASQDLFLKLAQIAKDNCPISKLMNAEVTMGARLEVSQG